MYTFIFMYLNWFSARDEDGLSQGLEHWIGGSRSGIATASFKWNFRNYSTLTLYWITNIGVDRESSAMAVIHTWWEINQSASVRLWYRWACEFLVSGTSDSWSMRCWTHDNETMTRRLDDSTSETSVNFCETTQCNIPEGILWCPYWA
jgi:hypothetical protein